MITENARVERGGRGARATATFIALGTLMDESHDSLRDDYEVSCAELDTMVDDRRGRSTACTARA